MAFFGTAPATQHARIAAHLTDEYGADVTHVSGALVDRARLRDELRHVEAGVFVVELKAAAVDVVVEEARSRGVEIVLAGTTSCHWMGSPTSTSNWSGWRQRPRP